MKKFFSALSVLSVCLLSAQVYNPTTTILTTTNPATNNVGIGTNTPSEKLTVSGGHAGSVILLHSSGDGAGTPANLSLWASEPGETYTGVGIGNNIKNNNHTFVPLTPGIGGSYMRLLENYINFNLVSNSGSQKQAAILTTEKFEVLGKLSSKDSSNEGPSLVLENPMKTAPNTARRWAIYNMTGNNYGNSLQFWNYSDDGNSFGSKLKLSDEGNMALYGKFEAKEIKVTLTPTADFVFAEDYNLPKLEDIEKHIKEKKHLPEIASAKVMEKEGVNVGEFQIKLLQKIEELTLYVIEQNKEIKEDKAILRVQSEKIAHLENQLKEIKTK